MMKYAALACAIGFRPLPVSGGLLLIIARKSNTPGGWMAFVPVANVYLMCQIGRCSAA